MKASEWKEKNRKTVTLKSGLVVTVRRLSPFALMSLGGIVGMEIIPPEKQGDVTKAILKSALVSPKIGDGPDEIACEDLDVTDLNELMEAITGAPTREEGVLPLAPTA